MAREKHIVDLTIGNFKRFADFEVKNLGQFNLIVGDNNTGKTSFLEALLFDEDIFQTVMNFSYSNIERRKEYELIGDNNSLKLFFNNRKDDAQITASYNYTDGNNLFSLRTFNDSDVELLSELEREKLFSTNTYKQYFVLDLNDNKTTTLQLKPEKGNMTYLPFVFFGLGYKADLINFYTSYIDVKVTTRNHFIESLKVFIPKINDVRVGNSINIYEEGIERPMPLYTYGEGANKLFRILCEIAICKGKRLMIDEIDAGIHYSRFKSFWRTIMQAAKAYDVQIFATTHNIECVEYFREVLEEEAMQEYQDLARIVSLKVKEDNSVKARVYDYEYMEYAKDANRELRGGGL